MVGYLIELDSVMEMDAVYSRGRSVNEAIPRPAKRRQTNAGVRSASRKHGESGVVLSKTFR